MAQSVKISQAGISAAASNAITGDSATGLTATGSTQATALLLGATVNMVATVAAATGVLVPPSNSGDEFFVYNAGANTLNGYPPVGATINSGAANAAFTLATTVGGVFKFANATALMAVRSA